jgi:hypothetical protein
MGEKREWALRYAALGWPCLPLCWPDKLGECGCGQGHKEKAVGKAPLTPHGVKDASTSPSRVIEWWERWPEANVGIATGHASGLYGVDLDYDKGGRESWEDLRDEHGPAPAELEQMTGNGRHLFFACPEGRGYAPSTSHKLGQGIDTRGDGSYVVAAPSVHRNGKTYAWDEGEPGETEPGPMPAWMIEAVFRVNKDRDFRAAVGELRINPEADVPSRRLDALLENVPKARATWEGRRKDLPHDDTNSGYDLALATMTAQSGWEDQMICDLLVARAIRRGEEVKSADYYRRTIARARDWEGRDKESADAALALEDLPRGEDPPAGGDGVLGTINRALGTRIERVVKRIAFAKGHPSGEPSYHLELAGGETVVIGGYLDLSSPKKFAAKYAAITNYRIGTVTAGAWERRYLDPMLAAVVTESLGEDASAYGQVRSWLRGYLRGKNVMKDWAGALDIARKSRKDGAPFEKDGDAYLVLDGLRTWLASTYREIHEAAALASYLRTFGAEQTTMAGVEVWRVPPDGRAEESGEENTGDQDPGEGWV